MVVDRLGKGGEGTGFELFREGQVPERQASNDSGGPVDIFNGGDSGAEVIRMHEKLERPEVLVGSTYKVKTPMSDHAMYVTINDISLNQGTEFEKRRP